MLRFNFQVCLLLLAGAVATAIGCLILIDPITFHAGAGIKVSSQPALLNELRAAGGTVLAVGSFALFAVFFPGMRLTAIRMNALVYGAYGISRFFSFIVDGVPNSALVWIALIELAVALVCVAYLLKFDDKKVEKVVTRRAG